MQVPVPVAPPQPFPSLALSLCVDCMGREADEGPLGDAGAEALWGLTVAWGREETLPSLTASLTQLLSQGHSPPHRSGLDGHWVVDYHKRADRWWICVLWG